MNALVIKACLNGMRGREQNPNVPWTPAEVASEARRCAEAGATAVHIHARADDGGVCYDAAWYDEADRRIRDVCDVVVNHTTARFPGATIDTVLGYLRETSDPPDIVSLNPGQIVFHMPPTDGRRTTLAIPNSYDEVAQILAVCRERGIAAEPTVLDTGFLSNVAMLVEDGLLAPPRYLLLEFSGRFGDGMQIMPGDARSYAFLTGAVRELYPDAGWLAHGIEESVFEIGRLAIEDGAHLRIGFEDRVTGPDGSPAQSNADLVAWAVEAGRAAGREPASPEDARALMLGR